MAHRIPKITLVGVSASNFKSFRQVDLDTSGFDVLIGANASGKSNLAQIFRFLRDLSREGRDNAVSLQGGSEFLRNILLENTQPVTIEARFKCASAYYRDDLKGSTSFDVAEVRYTLFIRQDSTKDSLHHVQRFLFIKGDLDEVQYRSHLAEGRWAWEVEQATFYSQLDHQSSWLPDAIEHDLLEALQRIGLYDISPRLSKSARPFTGKAELEEDGSNLALVLKNILEEPEDRRRFLNLITDVLPYVADLDVQRLPDRSVLLSLRETFSSSQYLPAFLLSDGTIQICALILALYYEAKDPVLIEEPERNIHPRLLSRVVAMMKDAAQRKRILVTTHNPEFVKHAGLDHLLLISRDQDGFSTVRRPAESAEVRMFLENELGLDDLYVQDLIGT